MSVVNGQLANQTTFNNAFMSRTAATTSTVAAVALENVLDVNSGAFVANLQRAINKVYEGLGTTGEADANINNYATNNYILNGDSRRVAIEKLDAQLKTTQDEVDAAELRIDDTEDRLDVIEGQPSTFGGDKTFTDDVVIQGNLTVQGTLTSIDTDNLEIEDKNILVNKGGNDATAEEAGVDVQRTTTNAGIRFDSTLVSKWKVGLVGAFYEVIVSGLAQVVAGLKDFTGGIKTDTVAESTLNAGVTVDGVLIKDGNVDGEDVSGLGTRLTANEALDVTQNGRLTTIESNNSSFGGNKTFTGDVTVQGNGLMKNVRLQENLFLDALINTQTGALVTLTPITAPIIKLTGAGLASIQTIDAPTLAKQILVINQSGADVIIKDNTGNIRTGTGADAQLANNQIVTLAYDLTAAKWYVSSVGGSAGGGSSQLTFDMKMNGLIGGAPAQNAVDGFWVAPYNCQITNVFIYQEVAGSGGTTNLDLKVKPFLSGAFTSIFLTTPKVVPASGANAWGGVGDSVTGVTAPVLSSLPFAVAAKSAIRMDLLGSQTGNAAGCGLIIVYEPI